MGRLVRAEWTKLLSTRVWIGLLLGGCVLAGGFAALITGLAGRPGGPPPVGTVEYEQVAFSLASNGSILSLVLGIIGMTQEYRHRTATPTFLAGPRRWRVVVAKVIGYLVAGIPFAAVVCAVDLLAIVIYTVIGVGVGALFRNQVGAIVGSLVYLFVIENVISGIGAISGIYKWLPGGALQAVTDSAQGPDVLDQWQGAVLLLAYGLVFAVLGTLLAVRRDVV
jgi:ABC-2 type transport system permease protein